MKSQKFIYSVYCWDGWQRGHIGDFSQKMEAIKIAKAASQTGFSGDLYYIQCMPGWKIIWEFEVDTMPYFIQKKHTKLDQYSTKS